MIRPESLTAGRSACNNLYDRDERVEMATFEICEAYSFHRLAVCDAEDAIGALNAYSDGEGFAPYAPVGSAEPDAIVPTVHPDGSASAPFTNYEIVARRVNG
jgi:hypothetical protein